MEINQEEKHKCIYCGNEAHYQFKNGKWCCEKNMNSCPAIKEKRKISAIKQWNELKEKGFLHKQSVPQSERKIIDLGQPGVCYYCGAEAKYQLKNKRWCCQKYAAQCPINRQKNRIGVKNAGIDYKNRYKNMSQQSKQKMAWSRGLTKETSQVLKKFGQTLHQKYQSGQIIHAWLGRTHTQEQKDKIVYGMVHKGKANNKGFKCGWYKGYWCDSSWQLAFIIYNLQHNIKFKRNYQGFNYYYENKIHRFYPDFIMQDGTYIQIKGWINQITIAKIQQFPKQLNIKMLSKLEMQKYFEYVKQKYGQNFIKLYQVKNEHI